VNVLALVTSAILLASCSPSPSPSVPWEDGLGPGARVIYHADRGLGVCPGLQGCPTRIVSIDGVCIAEVYRDSRWEFRESKPCKLGEP
jgi:hypothetical protein